MNPCDQPRHDSRLDASTRPGTNGLADSLNRLLLVALRPLKPNSFSRAVIGIGGS